MELTKEQKETLQEAKEKLIKMNHFDTAARIKEAFEKHKIDIRITFVEDITKYSTDYPFDLANIKRSLENRYGIGNILVQEIIEVEERIQNLINQQNKDAGIIYELENRLEEKTQITGWSNEDMTGLAQWVEGSCDKDPDRYKNMVNNYLRNNGDDRRI